MTHQVQWRKEQFILDDDVGRLDVPTVCRLLWGTYWAAGRSKEQIVESLGHSLCLGMYVAQEQIGFARAVTDYSTFTWLCDVVVDQAYRRRGLGKWMVDTLITHPLLQTNQLLGTRDAHSLYERFGFKRKEYMFREVRTR